MGWPFAWYKNAVGVVLQPPEVCDLSQEVVGGGLGQADITFLDENCGSRSGYQSQKDDLSQNKRTLICWVGEVGRGMSVTFIFK